MAIIVNKFRGKILRPLSVSQWQVSHPCFLGPMRMCSVMSDSLWTPWTVACQVPLSMEFSRQEYWSRLPFHIPWDLSIPGIKPMSLAVAGGFLTINAIWEALSCQLYNVSFTIQQKNVNYLYVQQKEST